MEYLMTYGWAILIIAIVMVAMFSLGVFNAQEPRAQVGACEVYHGSDVGECQGVWPQFVAVFNGGSMVQIATNRFNLPVQQNTGLTLSFWMYLTESQGAEAFLSGEIIQTDGVGMRVAFPAATTFQASDNNNGDGYTATYSFNQNQWYHVVVTVASGSSPLETYYVNGLQAAQGSSAVWGSSVSPYVAIGGNSAPFGFVGYLSNVQFYNTSLSQPEVTALYQEGIGGAPIDPNHIVGW